MFCFGQQNTPFLTVHHVHGDDVAQAFMRAIQSWSLSVGEAFHVVSPCALTLRGYAEAVAQWFGQEANLRFVSWDEFCRLVPEHDWLMTWDHIAHSPNGSIAKAQRLWGINRVTLRCKRFTSHWNGGLIIK